MFSKVAKDRGVPSGPIRASNSAAVRTPVHIKYFVPPEVVGKLALNEPATRMISLASVMGVFAAQRADENGAADICLDIAFANTPTALSDLRDVRSIKKAAVSLFQKSSVVGTLLMTRVASLQQFDVGYSHSKKAAAGIQFLSRLIYVAMANIPSTSVLSDDDEKRIAGLTLYVMSLREAVGQSEVFDPTGEEIAKLLGDLVPESFRRADDERDNIGTGEPAADSRIKLTEARRRSPVVLKAAAGITADGVREAADVAIRSAGASAASLGRTRDEVDITEEAARLIHPLTEEEDRARREAKGKGRRVRQRISAAIDELAGEGDSDVDFGGDELVRPEAEVIATVSPTEVAEEEDVDGNASPISPKEVVFLDSLHADPFSAKSQFERALSSVQAQMIEYIRLATSLGGMVSHVNEAGKDIKDMITARQDESGRARDNYITRAFQSPDATTRAFIEKVVLGCPTPSSFEATMQFLNYTLVLAGVRTNVSSDWKNGRRSLGHDHISVTTSCGCTQTFGAFDGPLTDIGLLTNSHDPSVLVPESFAACDSTNFHLRRSTARELVFGMDVDPSAAGVLLKRASEIKCQVIVSYHDDSPVMTQPNQAQHSQITHFFTGAHALARRSYLIRDEFMARMADGSAATLTSIEYNGLLAFTKQSCYDSFRSTVTAQRMGLFMKKGAESDTEIFTKAKRVLALSKAMNAESAIGKATVFAGIKPDPIVQSRAKKAVSVMLSISEPVLVSNDFSVAAQEGHMRLMMKQQTAIGVNAATSHERVVGIIKRNAAFAAALNKPPEQVAEALKELTMHLKLDTRIRQTMGKVEKAALRRARRSRDDNSESGSELSL